MLRTVYRKKEVVNGQNRICTLFASRVKEVTEWHHHLAEQLSRHEAPLTTGIMEFYWEQANEMNQARVAREKKLAKLKKSKANPK